MFIVLLGPPGAGKGTQAQLLCQRLGLPHLATGNLFREAIQKETPLGRQAKPYLDRGELVPDSLTVQLVRDQLAQPAYQAGAILDGFPRTVEQAQNFTRVLTPMGKHVDAVIYLKVPFEELVRRLTQRWTCPQCQKAYHLEKNPPRAAGRCDDCNVALVQRPDDSPDVVRRRLQVYMEWTKPLIEYYRAQGCLIEIPGTQSVAAVNDAIMAVLRKQSSVHAAT